MRRGVVIKTVINGMTFNGATKDPVQKAVRDALIAFMAATAQAQANVPISAASRASRARNLRRCANSSDKTRCLHRSPRMLGLAGKRSTSSKTIRRRAKPRLRPGGYDSQFASWNFFGKLHNPHRNAWQRCILPLNNRFNLRQYFDH